MSKRAQRRHHKQRMIKKSYGVRRYQRLEEEDLSVITRKDADHLKRCSCHYTCGNIRRNRWLSSKDRRTIQELKNHESYRFQLQELWNDNSKVA